MKTKQVSWLIVLIVVLSSLPYAIAAVSAGSEHVFGGFLFNPLDGNSYLAKMRQGWQGQWLFTLPYTVDPGQGQVLFLFYLALGHVARLTGIALPVMFHLARICAGFALGYTLAFFYRATLPDTELRWRAFTLGFVGAGLGWLAVPFGGFLPDLWVAEGYPFLSQYVNPHFPLSLATLLGILILSENQGTWKVFGLMGLLGLVLGIMQPFGVVIALVVLGGIQVVRIATRKEFHPGPFLAVFVGGLPMLAYQVWLVTSHPQLMVWNSQNLTPSPPAWEIFLALSPALILAGIAVGTGVRRKCLPDARLWVWAVTGFLLVFIPFPLQRRFLLGLFIPLAGLAPVGLRFLLENSKPQRRAWSWTFALSIPSVLLVLASGFFGVIKKDARVYLTRSQMDSFTWIAGHTDPGSRVLASPDLSLWIPAYTGRRVYYGHPYETVNADQEKEWVETTLTKLASGQFDEDLDAREVDYVLWDSQPDSGPAVPLQETSGLSEVYRSGDVRIYRVTREGMN